MSGSLQGKVAFVTGAARGQGRAFAVRLAALGADIIAVDICGEATPVGYPVATSADLAETVAQVERLGRRVVARPSDVRDAGQIDDVVREGASVLGGLDIVVANAGVMTWGRFWELPEPTWQDVIDINLTGVWHTLKSAAPVMIEQGRGGSMIAISSVAGLKSLPAAAHYSAAKHGVVGLVKAAAIELAPHDIRVNSIHPWAVNTLLAGGSEVQEWVQREPTYAASYGQLLHAPAASEPDDIADAVLWLASDASRCVTGIQLPIDHGATTV